MKVKLSNIQANILRSHGRNFSRFLFLKFFDSADPKDIQAAVHEIYFGEVSNIKIINNCRDQLQESKKYNLAERFSTLSSQKSIVLNMHLSFNGLRKIERTNWNSNQDRFLRKGMKSGDSIRKLTDLPIRKWEANYQRTIDAMVSIASNTEENLELFIEHARGKLAKIGKVLFVEKGKVLRWGKDAIEPFGFKDNISNPIFFKKEVTPDKVTYTPIDKNFDIALDERGGSFLVFRKLEQDTVAFQQKVKAISKRLKISMAYAEAQILGRFKDGTPLALYNEPSPPGLKQEEINDIIDFDQNIDTGYRDDPEGLKCPLHAHIRKTNPREDRSKIWASTYAQNNSSLPTPRHMPNAFGRIVRRGTSYEVEGESVGLLFMCYQASISHQFALIQQHWCNSTILKKLVPANDDLKAIEEKRTVGLDPIAGQYYTANANFLNKWQARWDWKKNKMRPALVDFKDMVTFRGGEFFYTPCIADLQTLNPADPV